jgi:hypothetical protein
MKKLILALVLTFAGGSAWACDCNKKQQCTCNGGQSCRGQCNHDDAQKSSTDKKKDAPKK